MTRSAKPLPKPCGAESCQTILGAACPQCREHAQHVMIMDYLREKQAVALKPEPRLLTPAS